MVTLHSNQLIWAGGPLMMPDEAHHAPDELLRAALSLAHNVASALFVVLRLFMFHNFSFIEEKFLCGKSATCNISCLQKPLLLKVCEYFLHPCMTISTSHTEHYLPLLLQLCLVRANDRQIFGVCSSGGRRFAQLDASSSAPAASPPLVPTFGTQLLPLHLRHTAGQLPDGHAQGIF